MNRNERQFWNELDHAESPHSMLWFGFGCTHVILLCCQFNKLESDSNCGTEEFIE